MLTLATRQGRVSQFLHSEGALSPFLPSLLSSLERISYPQSTVKELGVAHPLFEGGVVPWSSSAETIWNSCQFVSSPPGIPIFIMKLY